MSAPRLAVVVPHYDDPATLALLLRALDQQRDAPPFEVVVADDGSPETPAVPAGLGFGCRVVRQDDRGFRAAAARNLGAAATSAPVLVFLDGDTLPTAGYLAAVDRAVTATDTGHGALVVGERRHLQRAGTSDAALLDLLASPTGTLDGDPVSGAGSGAPQGVRELPSPRWLSDGYRRTDDLRCSGDEDFRLVISAVLALDRGTWCRTGGFDESFVGYGGEDWDLAWRAWIAGADRRHAPDAVAWHDGPDAGGRDIGAAAKNAESLRLAATIPLASTRGTGLVQAVPATAVRYLGVTTGTAQDAAVVATAAGWLDGGDTGVWFPGCTDPDGLPPLLREDPRVHAGEVPDAVTARAVHVVDLHRPHRLPLPAGAFREVGDREVPGWVRVQHNRSRHRGEPVPSVSAADAGVQPLPADVSLERLWGRW